MRGPISWEMPEDLRPMLAYFIHRYYLQAVSDYDIICRVKLAVVSCLAVSLLGGNTVATAQQYSKEIENDPDNVEEGGSVKGMELLDCETTLLKNKTRTQVKSKAGQVDGRLQFLSNKKISGYEIHMGKTIVAFGKAFPAGTSFGNVYGSYIHGFFDEGNIAFLICNYLAEQKGAAEDPPPPLPGYGHRSTRQSSA